MFPILLMLCFLGSDAETPQLKVTTDQATYAVDEAISFHVMVPRVSFLYLFNVDEGNGEIHLVYPTELVGIPLTADTLHLFPKEVEVYSSEEGMERFLFVACPLPLALEEMDKQRAISAERLEALVQPYREQTSITWLDVFIEE